METLTIKERILSVDSIEDFMETVCALTELKEFDSQNNPELETSNMFEVYEEIVKSALDFHDKYPDEEWGEKLDWYDTLSEFYGNNLRSKLFVL